MTLLFSSSATYPPRLLPYAIAFMLCSLLSMPNNYHRLLLASCPILSLHFSPSLFLCTASFAAAGLDCSQPTSQRRPNSFVIAAWCATSVPAALQCEKPSNAVSSEPTHRFTHTCTRQLEDPLGCTYTHLYRNTEGQLRLYRDGSIRVLSRCCPTWLCIRY